MPVVISAYVIVGDKSQLSVDVAKPVEGGRVETEHSMVTLAGHVIKGGLLSSIVMTWLQVLVLPQSSVDSHVLVIVYS